MADQLTPTAPTQTWLGKLFSTIASWFSKAGPVVHSITIIADNVANAVKNAEASQLGQLFEVGLEMAIPASTGLVNAFKLELNVIVTDLNWAVAEEGKTGNQIVQDGLTYLASIKGTDNYAVQLHAFAAKVQKWFSDNLGAGLTIEQALLTPQIVHNPALLGIANEIIGDVEGAQKVVNTVVDETQQAIDKSNAAPGQPTSAG